MSTLRSIRDQCKKAIDSAQNLKTNFCSRAKENRSSFPINHAFPEIINKFYRKVSALRLTSDL